MRPTKRRKLISGNSLGVIYSYATKVTSNARTRKEHLFADETIVTRVFTSGYVNTETRLHFFNLVGPMCTSDRTIAHVIYTF